MMKIIAGVHHEFDGAMKIKGREVRLRSAGDALANSIGMVHQELSVVPDLTVAENVFLGNQPVDGFRHGRLGPHEPRGEDADRQPRPRHRSHHHHGLAPRRLAAARRTVARAVLRRADHHSRRADLGPVAAGSEAALRRAARLRAEGRSIVFISHFLDDVLAISDRVTVFRNGQKVITEDTKNLTKDLVISHMIGRGSKGMHMGEDAELKGDDKKPVVLSVEGVSDGRNLRDFSIDLRAGEITGVYGFMGSGQIELARALFGKVPLRRGSLKLDGKPVKFRSTAAARKAGIAFVPENRRMMLFRTEPVYKNVSIAILGRIHRLLVKPTEEKRDHRGPYQGPADQAAAHRQSRWARCRAATSRRWRWPNG